MKLALQMFSPLMLNASDWRAIFAPQGRLLKAGDTIHRTNLSRTLQTIAKEGPGAFYKGPIADAIIDKVRKTGGILSHEDLENYQVQVQHALEGSYRGRKIYTPHAPTSGPVLIHMLNLMEHYPDLVVDGRTALNTHRLIEAMKCGFALVHMRWLWLTELPLVGFAARYVLQASLFALALD